MYAPGEGAQHGKSISEVEIVPPYWPDDEIVRSFNEKHFCYFEGTSASLGWRFARGINGE